MINKGAAHSTGLTKLLQKHKKNIPSFLDVIFKKPVIDATPSGYKIKKKDDLRQCLNWCAIIALLNTVRRRSISY